MTETMTTVDLPTDLQKAASHGALNAYMAMLHATIEGYCFIGPVNLCFPWQGCEAFVDENFDYILQDNNGCILATNMANAATADTYAHLRGVVHPAVDYRLPDALLELGRTALAIAIETIQEGGLELEPLRLQFINGANGTSIEIGPDDHFTVHFGDEEIDSSALRAVSQAVAA